MRRRNFGLCVIFGLVLPVAIFAEGVAEQIAVTPSNAMDLGFDLQDMGLDDDLVSRMITLRFPAVIHNDWPAVRVQTFLLGEDGEQLAGTSADYAVAGEAPSVFAHYHTNKHDLVFVVQYAPPSCESDNCAETLIIKEAYVISSVNEFLGPAVE